MRLFVFFLASMLSFSALADERPAKAIHPDAQVIRLCENPETGEPLQFPEPSAKSCPDGFLAYDDLTPAYVEAVEDIPPPKPQPDAAEVGAHAE
ncbi:MAG: hypothetical protein RIG84_04620 [Roseovarius sp.]